MTSLVIAEHNNAELNDATAKAVTAAVALGGDVNILVAGEGCAAVGEAAAKIEGVAKVLVADDAQYGKQMAEPVAALIVSLAVSYDAIVYPATTHGKNITTRVASLLDLMQLSDVTSVVSDDTF